MTIAQGHSMAKKKLSAAAELAFELGLKKLSVTGLIRLAKEYEKNVSACQTKADYVQTLAAIMSSANKLEIMQSFLLAGRVSVSLYRFLKDVEFDLEPSFKKASHTPQIVTMGPENEIIDGLQHVVWAVLGGENTYLDDHLTVRTNEEAAIVESFYDPATRILQIRSNSLIAKRIEKAWLKLANCSSDDIERIGLQSREQLHEFRALLKAQITKCKGQKTVSEGFGVVSGTKEPHVPDLYGTPDYQKFMTDTEPIEEELEFTHDDEEARVGFGFVERTIVFRKAASEPTIQHVYRNLKVFFGL